MERVGKFQSKCLSWTTNELYVSGGEDEGTRIYEHGIYSLYTVRTMGKVNIKKMAQSQQATFIVCIDLNQTCLTDSTYGCISITEANIPNH